MQNSYDNIYYKKGTIMCIYAMSDMFAFMTCQSKKEPNIYQAMNDLLRIDCSSLTFWNKYIDELDKIIDWINVYGCSSLFQLDMNESEPKDDDSNVLKELMKTIRKMHEGDLWNEFENSLKKKLKENKIQYINDLEENQSGRYVFYVLLFLKNIEMFRTIVDLFLFINGEPLKIANVAKGNKPLLPIDILVSTSSFFSLSKHGQHLANSFMLDSQTLGFLHEPNSTLELFEIYDCQDDDQNDFSKFYKDSDKVSSPFSTYPIYGSGPFGAEYTKLADSIITAYLDNYSSYEGYLKAQYSMHKRDENTNKYIKVKPQDLIAEHPEQLKGFIELRTTLANAILNSRIFKCEQCGKPFIAKRPDAKTCSDLCRNHLSQENRFKKKYNIK